MAKIATVGELRKALEIWNDETPIRGALSSNPDYAYEEGDIVDLDLDSKVYMHVGETKESSFLQIFLVLPE